MAITGRGRFPLRSAWGFRPRSRKNGGAFLSKMVRFGDIDTADSVVLKHFFFPATGASYTLVADTVAFTMTGSAAGLKVDNKLPVTVGTFTQTGIATALRRANKLPASVGTFTQTGTATSLKRDNKLPITVGTFSQTGQAAALRAARYLRADPPVTVPQASAEGVDDTEITLSWSPVPIPSGWAATGVDDTEITLTWSTVSLEAFNTTGVDVVLARGVTMPAANGAFAWTGNDARIFKVPAALIAEVGLGIPINFTAVNNASELVAFIRMEWDAGPAFLTTGNDVNLRAARRLPVTTGAFNFTGNDISFAGGLILLADSGVFTYTGNNARLASDNRIAGNTGTFAYSGTLARLARDGQLPTSTGVFLLTGNDANFIYSSTFVLSAETGAFTTTGVNAILATGRVLIALPGTFIFTGASTGTFVPPNEPLYIDLNTNKAFINLNTGVLTIDLTTGKTFIDYV